MSRVLNHPYSISSRLSLAKHYIDLGYPDLSVGEAYLALLLIDELEDETGEWHEDVVGACRTDCRREVEIEEVKSWELETYRTLVSSLVACDNFKSAAGFCDRGLTKHDGDLELSKLQESIVRKAGSKEIPMEDYVDKGLVRREVYAWNSFEPNRYAEGSVRHLNDSLRKVAPKLEAKITELDDLTSHATLGKASIVKQLGIFATEDLQPNELILNELSFLTASSRIDDSYCDACSATVTALGAKESAACEECYETIFCGGRCASEAPSSYHNAVCGADVSSLAKDVPASEAADALYFLLVARAIAMAATRRCHPLDLDEVKYLWGDFVSQPSKSSTLPFSFKYHILLPLHYLEKLDVNPFSSPNYSTWVINTLFAKFRGVASARQSPDGSGRPEVGAVHPLWCLANHSCDPNVRWSWEGGMKFWVRRAEELAVWDPPGNEDKIGDGREWAGIKAGEEILSHYCDIQLPVGERRGWAAGALGGMCRCVRCEWEAGERRWIR